MNGTSFLDSLISSGLPVTIRLTEGRDIQAVPVAQDADSILIRRDANGEVALVYKRAISLITPMGG